MSAAILYENRTCDELILLDIDATPEGRGPRFEQIEQFTSKLFCPVTVGGGVRSLDDIRGLLNAGADKVAIRTHARSPFLQDAVAKFGAQCITVGIDYREIHGLMAYHMAIALESDGVGEIILTNTDRDGTRQGYDIETLRKVCAAIKIPVIANGGCSVPSDMLAAIRVGAHAVAASSVFLFDDMTPMKCKEYLANNGVPVRIET
jgi:cyclase